MLSLPGFPPDTPVSSHSPKEKQFRLTANSKLSLGVSASVDAVTRLRPEIAGKKLRHPWVQDKHW